MPQQPEKQQPAKKIINTSPSQGLLSKLFGGNFTPEMEEGIRLAQQENPGLAPVKPYGLISRMFQPNSFGYTSPGQTIYLNPRTMEGQTPQDVADTLTHEQSHVSQMKERGYGPIREFFHEMLGDTKIPYHQRPDEIEAFNSEIARRANMGRMQTATPSFTTGEMITPQDIQLRKEKKIKTGPTSGMLEKLEREK